LEELTASIFGEVKSLAVISQQNGIFINTVRTSDLGQCVLSWWC